MKVWLNALTHCATVLCNAYIYYCFSFGTGGWVRVLWNYPWVYCLFWYGVRHNMEMPYMTLKLKKIYINSWFYAVLETLYFPIFSCVHRALTVRSQNVQRSFSVHLSFIPFSFIFILNSWMKRPIFAIHCKIIKEPVRKGWGKLILLITHHFHRNLIGKI